MRAVVAVVAASALAIPASALAGLDNPLKHAPLDKRAAEVVIPGKHCSKIGNPLECTHEGKSYPVPHKPSNPYANRSCAWAHTLYTYHHPPGTDKPWSLVAFSGCRLWHADLRYHSAMARAGVDESVAGRLESVALRSIPELIDIGGTR